MGIGNPIELLKMQSEAKKMQNKLRGRKIKGESKNGMVRVYMNGAQEFEDIYIDDAYLDPDMSDEIKKGMKLFRLIYISFKKSDDIKNICDK